MNKTILVVIVSALFLVGCDKPENDINAVEIVSRQLVEEFEAARLKGWFNIIDDRGVVVKHVEHFRTLQSGVYVFRTWDCKEYWVDPKTCRISKESSREFELRQCEFELEKLEIKLEESKELPDKIDAVKTKVMRLKRLLHEGEM